MSNVARENDAKPRVQDSIFKYLSRRMIVKLESLLPSPFSRYMRDSRKWWVHEFEPTLAMLEGKTGEVNFIQVGAFDGNANDPLQHLIRENKWNGILVEPQPQAFCKLQVTYRDQPWLKLEMAAVDTIDGARTLYFIEIGDRTDLPKWIEQIASFDLQTLLRARAIVPDLPEMIRSVEVPTTTISQLAHKHGMNRIDLLQIDAEGHDAAIIESIDFTSLAPSIIRFEVKNLRRRSLNRVLRLLVKNGYSLRSEGENAFAVRPTRND